MGTFWKIENVETVVTKKETIIYEEHFEKAYTRYYTGRYIVKMSLKDNLVCLRKSKDIAHKNIFIMESHNKRARIFIII